MQQFGEVSRTRTTYSTETHTSVFIRLRVETAEDPDRFRELRDFGWKLHRIQTGSVNFVISGANFTGSRQVP